MTTATLTNHMVIPRPRILSRKTGLTAAGKWGIFFIFCTAACTGLSLVAGFMTGLACMTAIAFLAAILGLYRPAVGLIGSAFSARWTRWTVRSSSREGCSPGTRSTTGFSW